MEALIPSHLALLLLAFVLLVGYKRLPDAARSLGRSLRIFRSEMHELTADDAPSPSAVQPPPSPAGAATEPSSAELEAQARAEEARAAELRLRAREARSAEPDADR